MSTREELVKAKNAAWDAWAVRAAAGDAASGYDAWDAARQALRAYDKNNTRRG